jgi:hypothetical protein
MLMAGLVGNTAHAQPATLSSSGLHRRTLERRAVEAAIWGMPLVNSDAMRQAFLRDAQATYGDLVFWSRPGRWKLQGLTPNTTVRYVFSFINTRQAGPVVVELPPTGDVALLGTVVDAWQVPLVDVGLGGEDQAEGANTCCCRPTITATCPQAPLPCRCRPTTDSSGCASLPPAKTMRPSARLSHISSRSASTR